MGRGLRCACIAAWLALLGVMPGPAQAARYRVANCTADSRTHSVEAFQVDISPGMVVSRRCAPETGDPNRGLGIGSVPGRGRVKRGAYAAVTLNAPPGTVFTSYQWTGRIKRADCGYTVQVFAVIPNVLPKLLKARFANRRCPPKGRALMAESDRTKPYPIPGATQIVQRIVCVGKNGSGCAAGSGNRLWTENAVAELEDVSAPKAGAWQDTPLARGEWVKGVQPLNYSVEDNLGVRKVTALIDGVAAGDDERPCRYATPGETYAVQVPCTNGSGAITVDTRDIPEGTRQLVVRAQDPAGNIADSGATPIRIDRTPPGRVDVAVEGGEDWRNRNDFAVWWKNPDEVDRAPIVAVSYRLCPRPQGACVTGTQSGPDIARLPVPLPAPGEWTVSLWRHDAAGNASQELASVPVTLRFDPTPPQLAFDPPSPADPTLVSVKVADEVSGIASGTIEISRVGSGTWHELPVTRTGDRMTARVDDVALPAGSYELRARASDLARNEASTTVREDGQQMLLNLPVRVVSTLQHAFERQRTVRRKGKRRPTVVQTQTARILFGESADVVGRLVTPAGAGIAGATVQVLATTPIGPEQLVAEVATDGDGRYRYTAPGNTSRTLRFVYAGSATVLPAEGQLSMTVPASSRLRVDRRRLRNGQAVTFSGPVRTLPTPPGGKLVEMQVKLPGRWETFRTIRSDDAGRWSVRYRFRHTSGVQRYRFRARLPAEGAYPYTAGVSRVVTVRVRGR